MCSRKLQILWEAVPGGDICSDFFECSHSYERWTHQPHNACLQPKNAISSSPLPTTQCPQVRVSAEEGSQWPENTAASQRTELVRWDGHQPCAGAGKLFFCCSLEAEGGSQTPSEQELHRNTGCLARLFPDNLAAIQHAPRFDHRNGTIMCWASCCGYCGFASYYNFNSQATALSVHITL